jgi:alkylation response protein AidB-like acyl-CoA dehydrogenase
MDFELAETHEQARELARGLGRRAVAPTAAARDRERRWDQGIWLELGAAGLLGVPLPPRYGGRGSSALESVVLQEGFGEGAEDAGLALAWGIHTFLCGVPLWLLGTESQRQRYLPAMCTGDWIGGYAASEPTAGSEATAIQTRATKRADRWILDGTKTWVTNGPVGHHFLVTAQVDPERGAAGIALFIVEAGFPGVRVGRALDTLGLRTAMISELVLDGCEVPEDNRLGTAGGEGGALWPLLARWERTCVFVHWLGLMTAAIERCTQRVTERHQFGRPISSFQAVRTMLADMKISHALVRQLSYRAAVSLDRTAHHADRDAAVAKLALSEAAQKTMRSAIQLHGTAGLVADQPLERAYRDAMALTIAAGSSEVLRSVIAGSLLHLG